MHTGFFFVHNDILIYMLLLRLIVLFKLFTCIWAPQQKLVNQIKTSIYQKIYEPDWCSEFLQIVYMKYNNFNKQVISY